MCNLLILSTYLATLRQDLAICKYLRFIRVLSKSCRSAYSTNVAMEIALVPKSYKNNCLTNSSGLSRDINGLLPSSSCSTPAHGIILKGLEDELAPHLRHCALLTSNGLRHHHSPSSYLSEVEASLCELCATGRT